MQNNLSKRWKINKEGIALRDAVPKSFFMVSVVPSKILRVPVASDKQTNL